MAYYECNGGSNTIKCKYFLGSNSTSNNVTINLANELFDWHNATINNFLIVNTGVTGSGSADHGGRWNPSFNSSTGILSIPHHNSNQNSAKYGMTYSVYYCEFLPSMTQISLGTYTTVDSRTISVVGISGINYSTADPEDFVLKGKGFASGSGSAGGSGTYPTYSNSSGILSVQKHQLAQNSARYASSYEACYIKGWGALKLEIGQLIISSYRLK